MQKRQKKCKVCSEHFTPYNSLQKVCGVPCSLVFVKNEQRKVHRKELAEFRKVNESKTSLLKKAQQAFNAYIRTRDYQKPCISCESWKERTTLRGQQMDAGHWYGTGAHSTLRFKTWNVHNQCVACNRDLSGNPHNYELGLIKRFGREWVAKRKEQAVQATPNHYSKDQLRRIAKLFRKKKRLYERFRDIP